MYFPSLFEVIKPIEYALTYLVSFHINCAACYMLSS